MMNRVREWREGLGLSQPDVARAAGCAASTISSIEAGNGCNGDTMYKLVAFAQGALSMADLISNRLRAELASPRRAA